MKDYNNYELVDFLLDDSFVEWASGRSKEDECLWLSWELMYPHKAELFDQALSIVKSINIESARSLTAFEVDILVSNVNKKISLHDQLPDKSSNRSIWFSSAFLKFAASIILIIGITLWLNSYFKEYSTVFVARTSSAFIERTNETSGSIFIILPDFTAVVLKPGAKLRYPKVFDQDKREVFLSGEAFFEVRKNAKQPFYVYANELVTKVLGTSFSVKAYKGDKEFKVIVNTGKVAVFTRQKPDASFAGKRKRVNAPLLLTPNQQVIFYRDEANLIKNDLPAPAVLSQKGSEALFSFKNAPFSEVVSALRRAYGVQIVYDKKTLSDCPLTAYLSTQSLYEKLDLICKALEVEYKVKDGTIIIEGAGCRDTNTVFSSN